MGEAQYYTQFGNLLKEYRRGSGLSLREFCRRHGFDHGNFSKLERGRLKPPTGKALEKYVEAVGIERETDEWYELHDTAAACAGKVPDRIMSDEQIVRKLPVVFRTLARRRLTEEELHRLIELIRES